LIFSHKPNSMTFKIIKADEPLQQRNLLTVIYSDPGVGKTTISFTMPKPLHLDFDKGLVRSHKRLRPDSVELYEFGDFEKHVMSEAFKKEIEQEGYQSIIIDTVGTLLDDFMAPHIIKTNPKNGSYSGGLTLGGWGVLGTAFNNLKVRFQNLGLEVCCIAHAKTESDGTDKRMGMAIKGQSEDILFRSADLIGYMYMIGDQRKLDFNPTQSHVGKNSGDFPVLDIPHADTPEFDGFLAGIITSCKEKMMVESQAQIEFNESLEQYKQSLDDCKKEADYDAFIASLADEPNKLLQTQLRKLLKQSMDGKGFKFDKESGKVINLDLKKETDAKASA